MDRNASTLVRSSLVVLALASLASAQGHKLWSAQFAGSSTEVVSPASISVDVLGDSFVSGTTGANTVPQVVAIRFDPNGNTVWTRTFGTPGFLDNTAASALNGANELYVAGTESTSAGSSVGLLLKFDASGNLLWTRKYSAPTGSSIRWNALAIDPSSGNVIAVGELFTPNSNQTIETVAYDSNGNLLWAQNHPSVVNTLNQPIGVAIDGANRVVVAGTTTSTTGGPDFTAFEYDAAGNPLWTSNLDGGGNQDDEVTGLALDSAGSVYLTGWSKLTGYLVTADYFTVKFKSDGTLLWSKRYDSPAHDIDKAMAITVSPAGDVFVSGTVAMSGTNDDIATVHYDTNGNLLWTRFYAGTAGWDDVGSAIALDTTGHVFVIGKSYEFSSAPAQSADFVTLALDAATGAPIWTETYDSPSHKHDEAKALAIDALGVVHVVGGASLSGGVLSIVEVAYGPTCVGSITKYCTAEVNSLGCTPSISMNGIPSATAGSGCSLAVSNLIANKPGLLMHSTQGAQAVTFHGGQLCIQPTIKRHAIKSSGGTAGQCDGALAEDFDAYIASGADPALVAGARVWIQAWSRDPATSFGDNLSDALFVTLCP